MRRIFSERGRPEKRENNKNKKSRSKSRNLKFGKGKSPKGSLKCYYCHKEGHFKRECPERKKKDNGKEDDSGEVSLASAYYDSSEALVVLERDSTWEWILDSGCSFHMTPHKEWLEFRTSCNEGSVLLGNNKSCSVAGKGSMRIKMFDGVERILNNVKSIAELKINLISLVMLDKERYSFKTENGFLKVPKGSLIVIKGLVKNGIYSLIGSIVIGDSSSIAKSEMDTSRLWHMRLGHGSERGLQKLSKQDMLCGTYLWLNTHVANLLSMFTVIYGGLLKILHLEVEHASYLLLMTTQE